MENETNNASDELFKNVKASDGGQERRSLGEGGCASCGDNELKFNGNQVIVPKDYGQEHGLSHFTNEQTNQLTEIVARRNASTTQRSESQLQRTTPEQPLVTTPAVPTNEAQPPSQRPTRVPAGSVTLADIGLGELICAGPAKTAPVYRRDLPTANPGVDFPLGTDGSLIAVPKVSPRWVLEEDDRQADDVELLEDYDSIYKLEIECGSSRVFVDHLKLTISSGKIYKGVEYTDGRLTAEEQQQMRRRLSEMYRQLEDFGAGEGFGANPSHAQAEEWQSEISDGNVPESLAEAIRDKVGGESVEDSMLRLLLDRQAVLFVRYKDHWECVGECPLDAECKRSIIPLGIVITGVVRHVAVEIMSSKSVDKDGKLVREWTYEYQPQTWLKYDAYFRFECKCPDLEPV